MADMSTPNRTAKPGDARGFQRMFSPGRLTLGVFFPIEAFPGDEPTMFDQERLARRAEELGFAALWFRDVPLRDPSFGDVGQVYEPWVYLGWIAAQTSEIALATGALVLTLRHPLHTAKGMASVDRLSGTAWFSALPPATVRSSSRPSASTLNSVPRCSATTCTSYAPPSPRRSRQSSRPALR
jgi:hypothetical protein